MKHMDGWPELLPWETDDTRRRVDRFQAAWRLSM